MNKKNYLGAILLLGLFLMGAIEVVVSVPSEAGSISHGKVKDVTKTVRHRAPMTLTVNAPEGPSENFAESVDNAKVIGVSHLTINLENTDQVEDNNAVNQVVDDISSILVESGFTRKRYTIIRCPLKCDGPGSAGVPAGTGTEVTLLVHGIDGATPQFRADVRQARAQNVSRIAVMIDDTRILSDADALGRVVQEIKFILQSYYYTSANSSFTYCETVCP